MSIDEAEKTARLLSDQALNEDIEFWRLAMKQAVIERERFAEQVTHACDKIHAIKREQYRRCSIPGSNT
jgi:hypothetical protein